MKVLSFLEFSKLSNIDKYNYLSNFEEIQAKPNKDLEIGDCQFCASIALAEHEEYNRYYRKLIEQPFKPELVAELFEGWIIWDVEDRSLPQSIQYQIDSVQTPQWHVQIWNTSDVHMRIYSDDTLIEWGYHRNDNYYHFPRTLDDFINDCQQAGIELKWRVK